MNLLVIHGTGARKTEFDKTFSFVKAKVQYYVGSPNIVTPISCLWGDEHGAKLLAGGRSIPQHDDDARDRASNEDEVTWAVLYADPFTELRILAERPTSGRVSLGAPPGELCVERFGSLGTPELCKELLIRYGLIEYWATLQADSGHMFRNVATFLKKANRSPSEMAEPVARALVAMLLHHARQNGHPGLVRNTRDELVASFVGPLGGPHEGIGQAILAPVLDLAKNLSTSYLRRERLGTSNRIAPYPGDILLYQARGSSIRQCIREAIEGLTGPVTVLAHSLGGIAVADLLIMENLKYTSTLNKGVAALVTVGSQVSLFYELNALTSLEFGLSLPSHFPTPWFNFWDPNDFLSYVANPVFGDAVRDVRVDSGEPFPEAHSAYWNSALLWSTIGEIAHV